MLQVRLNQVGCMGACERGPNIRVRTSPGAGQGGEAKIYEINAVSNLAKVTSVLRDLLNLPVSDVAVATLEANLAGNAYSAMKLRSPSRLMTAP